MALDNRSAPIARVGDAQQADRQERPATPMPTSAHAIAQAGRTVEGARGQSAPQHRYGPSEGSALPELLGALGGGILVMALLTIGYLRQGYSTVPDAAQSQWSVATLMLFTLSAAVVIGGVILARFISKPQNRVIAEKTIGTG